MMLDLKKQKMTERSEAARFEHELKMKQMDIAQMQMQVKSSAGPTWPSFPNQSMAGGSQMGSLWSQPFPNPGYPLGQAMSPFDPVQLGSEGQSSSFPTPFSNMAASSSSSSMHTAPVNPFAFGGPQALDFTNQAAPPIIPSDYSFADISSDQNPLS